MPLHRLLMLPWWYHLTTPNMIEVTTVITASRSWNSCIRPRIAENLDEDEALTRRATDGKLTLQAVVGQRAGRRDGALGEAGAGGGIRGVPASRRGGDLHRPLGGGTVFQTPGVLNYSLTAPAPGMPNIRSVFSVGARLLVGALEDLGLRRRRAAPLTSR